MSRKLLESVLEGTRGMWAAEHMSVLTAAQLLAWAKLSSERRVGVPDFGAIIDGLAPKGVILRGLKLLSQSESLGESAAAFDQGAPIWKQGNPSPGVLHKAARDIKNAVESGAVNYQELTGGLYERFPPEDFVPFEVAELMLKLAGVMEGETVYCPFSGSYYLAAMANRLTREVYTEGEGLRQWPHLFAILEGGFVRYKRGNPITAPNWIESPGLKRFEAVLANPPFGERYDPADLKDAVFNRFPPSTQSGDMAHVAHILAQTRCRAVVLVPQGFLTRTSPRERAFKADLISRGLMRAVIDLPGALLKHATVNLSLLLLGGNSGGREVNFVDASTTHFYEVTRERGPSSAGKHRLINTDLIAMLALSPHDGEHSRLAGADECASKDYSLLPSRYVLTQEQIRIKRVLQESRTERLDALAQLIRPQSVAGDDGEAGTEFGEVLVSDIEPNGLVRDPSKRVVVSDKKLPAAKKQLLKPGDILLAVKGSIGKVGIVPESAGENWLPGQSFQVVRLPPDGREFIDPVVLYSYLVSSTGQALLKSRAAGMSVQMIQTSDVKSLAVIVPPFGEQQRVFEAQERIQELRRQIEEIEQEMDRLRDQPWGG